MEFKNTLVMLASERKTEFSLFFFLFLSLLRLDNLRFAYSR